MERTIKGWVYYTQHKDELRTKRFAKQGRSATDLRPPPRWVRDRGNRHPSMNSSRAASQLVRAGQSGPSCSAASAAVTPAVATVSTAPSSPIHSAEDISLPSISTAGPSTDNVDVTAPGPPITPLALTTHEDNYFLGPWNPCIARPVSDHNVQGETVWTSIIAHL